MHAPFLPHSRSHFSMQTHAVTLAFSVMDAGHKDGQDEKASHIRVCGPLMYVRGQSGVHVRVCLLKPMCVPAEDLTESRPCFALTRNYKTLPFHPVCLSFDCFRANDYFSLLLPSLIAAFFLLDQISQACMASLLHLLLFPFVP